MDPYAQSANAGNIGQYVAVVFVGNPTTGRSDADTDYKEADHIYNCPPGTVERTATVPGDYLACQKIILPFSWHLGPCQH